MRRGSVLEFLTASTRADLERALADLRFWLRVRHSQPAARDCARLKIALLREGGAVFRELIRARSVIAAAEHWHAVITAIPAASPVDVANAEQAIAKAVRGE